MTLGDTRRVAAMELFMFGQTGHLRFFALSRQSSCSLKTINVERVSARFVDVEFYANAVHAETRKE